MKYYLYRRHQSTGFTLIEVMISMAIFSIVGLSLLSTSSSTLNGTRRIEQQALANWVASNQLVEVKLSKQWPPKNNQKGKVTLADTQWYWSQKVLKTTDDTMKAVVVEVRQQEKDKQAITSLTTYVVKN